MTQINRGRPLCRWRLRTVVEKKTGGERSGAAIFTIFIVLDLAVTPLRARKTKQAAGPGRH